MDSIAPAPPRAGDRLLLVCVLSFLMLVAGLSVGLVLGELRDQLELSGVIAAAHGSTFGLGLLVAAVAGLRLTEVVGRTRVFWGAAVAVAAGITLLCLGTAWPVTLLGTAVSGLGAALLVMLMPGIIADGFGDQRADKFAQVNAYPGIAGIAFSLAIGAVIGLGGSWRVPYLLITLALLAILVAVGRHVPLPPASHHESHLRAVLRRPAVRRAWGSLVLVVVVEFSIATWAVTYVKEVGGASGGMAAAIGAVWGSCIFVGRLSLPRYRRAVGAWATSLALVAAAVGIVWLWVGPGLWARVAALAVIGLGCSVLYPLAVDRLYDDGPDDPVVLGAVAALGSGTAIILGPPLVGALADRVGLRAAIVPLAVLALVGAWQRAPRRAPAPATADTA